VLSELHEAKEPALREARFVPDRTMYITLFFDVEDCVTPLSDDIAKDLADTLSDHGLKGEFMVVGDKARMLEKRGRWDVIEALRRHEVGLHTNRHSRHPNVAEYLEDNRWRHTGFHVICPQCDGEMKVISFIEDHKVIDKIIAHLKLIFMAERPPPSQVVQQELLMAAEERGEYL